MEDEVDVIEIKMNESEIDEVVASLIELKENKNEAQISLASDLDLHIKYDHEPEEEI